VSCHWGQTCLVVGDNVSWCLVFGDNVSCRRGQCVLSSGAMCLVVEQHNTGYHKYSMAKLLLYLIKHHTMKMYGGSGGCSILGNRVPVTWASSQNVSHPELPWLHMHRTKKTLTIQIRVCVTKQLNRIMKYSSGWEGNVTLKQVITWISK
jgi:hypothetical protein